MLKYSLRVLRKVCESCLSINIMYHSSDVLMPLPIPYLSGLLYHSVLLHHSTSFFIQKSIPYDITIIGLLYVLEMI